MRSTLRGSRAMFGQPMQPAVTFFNERFRDRARPLTLALLARQPVGRLERPGSEWRVAYALFDRDSKSYLGVFSSHPQSNSFYVELDAMGAVVHSWSSWEPNIAGSEEHNLRGVERAKAAGIPM